MLGPRGSGKTDHGEWLARQLGLFHIQLREQLQTLIMAKTNKKVPRADESVWESLEEDQTEMGDAIVDDPQVGCSNLLLPAGSPVLLLDALV